MTDSGLSCAARALSSGLPFGSNLTWVTPLRSRRSMKMIPPWSRMESTHPESETARRCRPSSSWAQWWVRFMVSVVTCKCEMKPPGRAGGNPIFGTAPRASGEDRDSPVISAGFGMPIRWRTVGAISARRPPSLIRVLPGRVALPHHEEFDQVKRVRGVGHVVAPGPTSARSCRGRPRSRRCPRPCKGLQELAHRPVRRLDRLHGRRERARVARPCRGSRN